MSVHGSHCCKEHGCKYDDSNYCPVVNGTEEQEFRQECCETGDNILIEAYETVICDMKRCGVENHIIESMQNRIEEIRKRDAVFMRRHIRTLDISSFFSYAEQYKSDTKIYSFCIYAFFDTHRDDHVAFLQACVERKVSERVMVNLKRMIEIYNVSIYEARICRADHCGQEM
jgi:hypothetical protein